jgi:hypothetical protein
MKVDPANNDSMFRPKLTPKISIFQKSGFKRSQFESSKNQSVVVLSEIEFGLCMLNQASKPCPIKKLHVMVKNGPLKWVIIHGI